MRAVVITRYGGPEVLQVEEVDDVRIERPNDVRIKVKAIGVNRPDVFQRKGNYPSPEGVRSDIPGLEVAGILVESGSEVKRFNVGDRVMALVSGAGYAEEVVVDEGTCLEIPVNLTFEEAATLPENLFTVWHNVFQRGKLLAGHNFLVHGGAGGIGYTAIQLAKLFGATVFTTVSTDKKEDFVRMMGADHIVNYNQADFSDEWKKYKLNVVLDSIGGPYFEKNITLLNEDGVLVYINAVGGREVQINLLKLMQKRIMLTGSTLRTRDLTFKAQLAREVETFVFPFIRDGRFKIHIDRTFSLDDACAAHEYMENGNLLGKVVFSI